MAVTFTVTPVKEYVIGDRKEVIVDVACTGTPTVGGDVLTAAQLGLSDELDVVQPAGGASVVGATSAAAIMVIHPAGTNLTQVLLAFMVQGVAGAANSMVAYSGATAGFAFRLRAVGKGVAS